MNVQYFYGKSAVKTVNQFVKQHRDELGTDLQFINGWMKNNNTRHLHAFVLYENGEAASVAVLSKCKYDPMREQEKPHVLDFVYTVSSKRARGYCTRVVQEVQKRFQFTSFSTNSVLGHIFNKLKCTINSEYESGPGVTMYRWNNVD